MKMGIGIHGLPPRRHHQGGGMGIGGFGPPPRRHYQGGGIPMTGGRGYGGGLGGSPLVLKRNLPSSQLMPRLQNRLSASLCLLGPCMPLVCGILTLLFFFTNGVHADLYLTDYIQRHDNDMSISQG